MKKYLVPDSSNPEKFAIIGASGFVPQGVIAELPEEMHAEEAEWLIVNEGTVRVDELLKAEILAEREMHQKQYEKAIKAAEFLKETDYKIIKMFEAKLSVQDLSLEEKNILKEREAARLDLGSGQDARR